MVNLTKPVGAASSVRSEPSQSAKSDDVPKGGAPSAKENGVPNLQADSKVLRPGRISLAEDEDVRKVRELAAFWREVLSVELGVMSAHFSCLRGQVSTVIKLAEIQNTATESSRRAPRPSVPGIESPKSLIAPLELMMADVPARYAPYRKAARHSVAQVEAISEDLVAIEAWLSLREGDAGGGMTGANRKLPP